MLTLLLWAAAGAWALFLVFLALNWVFGSNLTKTATDRDQPWPPVSIVVPARNEEVGIRAAVTSFLELDYPELEVIVVDDDSSDRTPEILAGLQATNPKLTVVPSAPLAPGWLGKVNALETGRQRASGDWLLFVDADVVYESSVLKRAIALAEDEDVHMVAAVPVFDTVEVLEACILSTFYLLGYALLPTFLVKHIKLPLFAVGGGVFNLVRRDALEAADAFTSLKGEIVDDVGLGIKIKAAGYRLTLAEAGDMIRVRMYGGTLATIRGFTKNAYPGIARNSPWLALLPVLLGTWLFLLPYAGLIVGMAAGQIDQPSLLSLVIMHSISAVLAVRFLQPWQIAFLNPAREILWWLIFLRSYLHYRRHGLVWRGRRYPL